jgi:hypothetical protein
MLVCVLFMGADQPAIPTEATRAIRAWLDGDAGAALAALARLPPSRERDFSQGVVLLYSGDAGAAERVFRALLGHHNFSNDSSSARHEATVDIDPATGAFRDRQVSAGLFVYDVLPIRPNARPHDGLSMIGDARAAARAATSLFVLRIADATWKGTLIRSARAERIRWQHREIDTECVEIGLSGRGTAGVQGTLQLWISADDRAIPYRAKMAMSVGSVTLELMPGDAGEVPTRG